MTRSILSRRILAVVTASIVALVAGGASAGPGAPLVPSANERRAVRGRAVPEVRETPEQATVRRFEESLPVTLPAPGDGAPVTPAPTAAAVAAPAAVPVAPPADLPGAWAGSGDEPLPRTPQAPVRPSAPTADDPLAALYRDFFTIDPAGRAVVEAWSARLAPWRRACEAALDAAGVPASVLVAAVALTGFDVDARGAGGEAGPWFLTAAAARAHGLDIGFWRDERRDPVRATEAAAALVKAEQARLGSAALALAALVLGRDAVAPGSSQATLPRPARLLLGKVAALGDALAAHAAAGRDGFTTLEVPTGMTLDTIARVTGVDVPRLRALNPAWLRDRAAPGPVNPFVRVPVGTRRVELGAFEAARATIDRVVVVRLRLGESAEQVAAARGVGLVDLKRLHGVRAAEDLRGPMDLLVPGEGGAVAPVAVLPSEVDDESAGPPLVAIPPRGFDVPGRQRVFYFVNDGDTLEEIAEASGLTPAEIVGWNHLDAGARLQARMVLQLYVRPDLDRSRIAVRDEREVRAVQVGSDEFHALEVARRGKTRVVHTVRPGDTMPKLARRYGLPAADLARINRMSWNSELTDGQRIVVYAPAGASARVSARETAAGRSAPAKRPEASRSAAPVRKISGPVANNVSRSKATKSPARVARPAGGR